MRASGNWIGWLAFALALPAVPGEASAVHYGHEDWELVCDNTRTCRAAGYQEEGDEHAVSVLLTRRAGPGTVVEAQVQLGSYGEDDQARIEALPEHAPLALWIDGRRIGELPLDKESLVAGLPPSMLKALLLALRGEARIEWRAGDSAWTLSGRGAMAVLLKMDEAQGRVGTPGALARRGKRAEAEVLPPLPAPVVVAVSPPASEGTVLESEEAVRMRALLAGSLGEDVECDGLAGGDADVPEQLTVWPLSPTRQLVQAHCWRAAYNEGNGYWVVGGGPPVLVTDTGTEYDGRGEISSSLKGRGLGDCWSQDAWTWDGENFVHTAEIGHGACRLVSPGGAWELPVLVTDVRPQAR